MKSIIFSVDGRENIVNSILSKGIEKNLNLNVELGEIHKETFSDGEFEVDFITSVRGKRVYLVSSADSSDEIMRLNFAIDAAKRNYAREIIPILPYFPYARQDKKDQARGAIGAKVIAGMLEQRGATSIITFDLHADQIQGFFEIPVTHIEGKTVFDEYVASLCTEDSILCGPDAGSGKRVKRMRDQLFIFHEVDLGLIMMDKIRGKANVVEKMTLLGDVTGKDVIIIDDMIDTFGTADKAINMLFENGAKSVRMVASHPVLSGPAYDRIANSKITELIVSDSLPIKNHNKIKVISVTEQIAKAISAINNDLSYDSIKTIKNPF